MREMNNLLLNRQYARCFSLRLNIFGKYVYLPHLNLNIFCKQEMKSLIYLSALLLFACTSTPIKSDLSDESRKEIDSIIRVTPGIDSLSILLVNHYFFVYAYEKIANPDNPCSSGILQSEE